MTAEKPRILFVDDDINILKALGRSFRGKRREWALAFAESGEAALLEVGNRCFDVMVTDLAMPGMSGLDLVGMLNESAPETRCIILTGTADLQTATEIINTARVFRFYTKPCETAALTDGITAALAEKHAASGFVSGDDPGKIVLDRLATGVLVVTRKGEVVYMNQSAAQTVAAADGLSIGHDQVLRASTGVETGRLKDVCLRLDSTPDDDNVVALSIERPSMREALKLIFTPFENPEGESQERVIVFVTDPDREAFPSPEMIARLFDLTPTESNLASALIRGQRTEEIAETLGITISSARTYVKRVMEKTGTNRQMDLVRLLLSTPRIMS